MEDSFAVSFFVCSFIPWGILGLALRLIITLVVCAVPTIIMLFFTKNGKQVLRRFRLVKKVK